MPGDALDDDLSLALALADAADEVTMARFRALDLRVDTKPDLTPVSDADRAAEQAIRDVLATSRPGDAVLGEEQGATGGDGARRRWIVDPIDGTKGFVRGLPVWATLVALEDDGEIVVGVVSAPALGRRWWAARGAGAHAASSGGEAAAIRVSAIASLSDAHLSYPSERGFDEVGLGDRFRALAASVWRARGLGDFWSHVLVAEGSVDVGFDPVVSLWDLAPLQVIVEEAGGRFTDFTGQPRVDGGSAISSNGLLHDAVLDALGR